MTRSLRARVITLAIGAFGLATIHDAAAQEPIRPSGDAVDRSTAAEDLFQRAKTHLATRDFETACPLLLESFRLDPAGGTLQNLAVCYEELGKWASAYARFQELRAMSKHADPPRLDRIKLADEHIAKLEPKLSRIVVVVPEEVASTATVTIDGVNYLEPSWSSGILVDPGPHDIVVSAPDKEDFVSSIVTPTKGEQQKIRVTRLVDKPRPAEQNRDAVTTPDRERAAPREVDKVGLVVGAVGLGVLAAGGVFGVMTFMKNDDAKDKCSASTNPGASRDDFDPVTGRCYVDSNAQRDANVMKDEARTLASVANVLIPVGVVGLGVGVYMVLRNKGPERSTKQASMRLSPSIGGALLEGNF